MTEMNFTIFGALTFPVNRIFSKSSKASKGIKKL